MKRINLVSLILRGWILPVALCATTTSAFADDTGKTLSRSYAVSPGGEISLEVEQSDVEIISGDENTVSILMEREIRNGDDSQAAKAFKNHKVTFIHEGNHVHVQALTPKTSRSLFSSSPPMLNVRFRITVPKRFNAAINTTGGNIQVAELQGTVDARTSGGDVTFNKIQGVSDAHTSGGNIKAAGCSDRLILQTSGGSIFIKDFSGSSVQADDLGGNIEAINCSGKLTVKTSGGNIMIENFSGVSAFADTSGGSISTSFTTQPTADCYFRTGGGNVTARLPENIAINLLATTGGGSLNSTLPVALKGKEQEGKIEGKINGGGPIFSLKTSGGDVQIIKQ